MISSALSKNELLRDRSSMLKTARQFFYSKNILEVDCPAITQGASVDSHIDLIKVSSQNLKWRYLHSSPEYGMKRLIADGIGDIYQLSHVFRDGESSTKHNPEFMMAEWYRMDFSFEMMIQETIDFISLFLGKLPFRVMSYGQVFREYAGIDYFQASIDELLNYLTSNDVTPYPGVESEGKDAVLNLILGSLIEPKLGDNELFVLAYYPASQAALAKTRKLDGELVAERFEVYYRGIELANGYHELTDAVEQRARFLESNQFRSQLGKEQLPIDEYFLHALQKGFPDCSGVAVGFDRLMMLRHDCDIEKVIPFTWDKA